MMQFKIFKNMLSLTLCLIYVQSVGASTEKIRLLVLVLASDNLPVYIDEQKIWRSYMHYNPEQVQAFFIKGNPRLRSRHAFDTDIIWSKTTEGYPPRSAGLINKTVMSLEALEDQLDNFDYILRTNMSSFFVFERLLRYLATLPKEGVYCGMLGVGGYVSGAGIIMSRDIAKLVLQHKNELLNNAAQIDDMLLGTFMSNHGVESRGYEGRVDIASLQQWHDIKDSILSDTFHFRLVNYCGRRSTDEIYVYNQLRNMFY